MILFKATKYIIWDLALNTLIDNIIKNFPFLIKVNLKVGTKIQELTIIFNLDSYDTLARGVMKNAVVIANNGDTATFKFESLTLYNTDGLELWADYNNEIELPIDNMK